MAVIDEYNTLYAQVKGSTNDAKSIAASNLVVAQQQAKGTLLTPAEDGALALTDQVGGAQLQSASGAKAITTTSSYPGQKINLFLLSASGGSYTLALDSGTLTLDAASESATIMRTAADDAWVVVGLSGATIV